MFCVVACPAPEIGTNIKPVPQSLNCSAIGTIYTYECLDCYVPPENLVTICQSAGRWSLPPPICQKRMYLTEIKIKLIFWNFMRIQLYFVNHSLLLHISRKYDFLLRLLIIELFYVLQPVQFQEVV